MFLRQLHQVVKFFSGMEPRGFHHQSLVQQVPLVLLVLLVNLDPLVQTVQMAQTVLTVKQDLLDLLVKTE
jgi:hypothetical protein